jgi:hypothetical protein
VLTPAQSAIVLETLRVSLASAAGEVDGSSLASLAGAAAALAPPAADIPHPAWPAVGASVDRDLVVSEEDSAAALGHPDAGRCSPAVPPSAAAWSASAPTTASSSASAPTTASSLRAESAGHQSTAGVS